jgi:hypothetical protein
MKKHTIELWTPQLERLIILLKQYHEALIKDIEEEPDNERTKERLTKYAYDIFFLKLICEKALENE